MRKAAPIRDLEGKTAVVTGAASGMGRAFADRLARAGMRVVLADIEPTPLHAAVAELEAQGATAIGVVTDVSSERDMSDATYTRTRAVRRRVDVVCLNAGVAGGTGPMETLTVGDWQWTLGVNLWGIIHGIHTFVPDLKRQDSGHIVITASIAGLTSFPNMGPYNVTKHSAVAIAETLFSELHDQGSSVGVSCLCPGVVHTNIMTSERNRPEALRRPLIEPERTDEDLDRGRASYEIFTNAKPPHEVADLVHDAIVERRFWIFTDEVFTPEIITVSTRFVTEPTPPTSGLTARCLLQVEVETSTLKSRSRVLSGASSTPQEVDSASAAYKQFERIGRASTGRSLRGRAGVGVRPPRRGVAARCHLDRPRGRDRRGPVAPPIPIRSAPASRPSRTRRRSSSCIRRVIRSRRRALFGGWSITLPLASTARVRSHRSTMHSSDVDDTGNVVDSVPKANARLDADADGVSRRRLAQGAIRRHHGRRRADDRRTPWCARRHDHRRVDQHPRHDARRTRDGSPPRADGRSHSTDDHVTQSTAPPSTRRWRPFRCQPASLTTNAMTRPMSSVVGTRPVGLGIDSTINRCSDAQSVDVTFALCPLGDTRR